MTSLARSGKIVRRRRAGSFVARPAYPARSTPISSIAAIVTNVTCSAHARFVHTLGMKVGLRQWRLYLGVTNDRPELERQFIEYIARRNVLGVLKFATNPEFESEARALLRLHDLPYVIIDDFWSDSRQDHHVAYDECAAAEAAVEHLAGLGHRRIALVDTDGWTRLRLMNAFLKALERKHLPSGDENVLLCSPSLPPPVERLYGTGMLNPTAIVTAFAMTAANLIGHLRQFEMCVPGDVSVVNINGRPLEPPFGLDVTATVPPNAKMVDQAIQLLEEWPHEDQVHRRLFRPTLHIGDTTAVCREPTVESCREGVSQRDDETTGLP